MNRLVTSLSIIYFEPWRIASGVSWKYRALCGALIVMVYPYLALMYFLISVVLIGELVARDVFLFRGLDFPLNMGSLHLSAGLMTVFKSCFWLAAMKSPWKLMYGFPSTRREVDVLIMTGVILLLRALLLTELSPCLVAWCVTWG